MMNNVIHTQQGTELYILPWHAPFIDLVEESRLRRCSDLLEYLGNGRSVPQRLRAGRDARPPKLRY